MEIIGDYNSDEKKKKKNWKPMGPFVVLAVQKKKRSGRD